MSFFKNGALVENTVTTATAAGTTTLVASSATNQQFTGTAAQTIVLPDATTMSRGRRFRILNRSTQALTVNFYLGSLASTVPAGTECDFLLVANGMNIGSWDIQSSAAGTTDTQTITNKTIGDALTFTQIATPASPGSGFNKIYPKTTGKFYTLNSAGIETAIGAGSGGTNFIGQTSTWSPDNTDDRDFEATLGNWATFANTTPGYYPDGGMTGGSPVGVAISRSTANPLDGSASLLITKDAANRQGEGCSVPFNVQPAYQGAEATITCALRVVSGAIVQGDVKFFVYNVTTGELITPYNNDVIVGPTLLATFPTTARAATPANQQYRLGIYFASTSTSAVSLQADDFSVSPGVAAYGMAGSGWVPSTHVTLSNLGATTYDLWERRVGDHLEVSGAVQMGSGTVGQPAIVQLTGLNIDTSKRGAVDGQKVGDFYMSASSTLPLYGAGVPQGILFYDGSTSDKIYFATSTYSSNTRIFTQADASGIQPSSSSKITINFTVPIAGWDANVTMAQSSTFKISSYLANGTRVVGVAPANLGEYRSYLRNAGASTYTETSGAPTTPPNVSNGIRLDAVNAYASADSAGLPSKYDIFVGKNKNVRVDFYENPGRTGFLNVNYVSTTADSGCVFPYDPTTGIITVYKNTQNGSVGQKLGYDDAGNYVQTGYFDITVSENALAVGVQAPRSELRASDATANASTNVRTRIFNSSVRTGTAITHVKDPALGDSFVISEDGVYSVNGSLSAAAIDALGITLNANPAIALDALPPSQVKCYNYNAYANAFTGISWTGFVPAGAVLRMQQAGTSVGSSYTPMNQVTITKVSN
jgi:hypothetical protein